MDPGRDFSTISPSALSLLVMRAQTEIPFARAAAEVLWGAEGLADRVAAAMQPRGAELRRLHFEERYRSVDAALAERGATRVLELAGGLSFRGLALAARAPVDYLDTDLPEMVATKARLVAALHPGPLVGSLRLRALDALDAVAFAAAAAELSPGPFAVVNEGLLMYLGPAEKARLAATIRAALLARGGVWITADLYVQRPEDPRVEKDAGLRQFLADHRVEENKFASWDAAERFFAGAGFTVERRRGHAGRETWTLAARP